MARKKNSSFISNDKIYHIHDMSHCQTNHISFGTNTKIEHTENNGILTIIHIHANEMVEVFIFQFHSCK